MYEVTIRIEDNIATLECLDRDKNPFKKQYIAEKEETKNATTLAALILALEHMQRSSMITIELDNRYVYGAILNNWLSTWRKNDWQTAKGKEVANKGKWIYIAELLNWHSYKAKELGK